MILQMKKKTKFWKKGPTTYFFFFFFWYHVHYFFVSGKLSFSVHIPNVILYFCIFKCILLVELKLNWISDRIHKFIVVWNLVVSGWWKNVLVRSGSSIGLVMGWDHKIFYLEFQSELGQKITWYYVVGGAKHLALQDYYTWYILTSNRILQ